MVGRTGLGAVHEHLCSLGDSVSRNLVVVEPRPVGGEEHVRTLQGLRHLGRLIKHVRMRNQFQSLVFKRIRLVRALEADDSQIACTKSINKLSSDVFAGVAEGARDRNLLFRHLKLVFINNDYEISFYNQIKY